jgi:hypothetical protein
MLAAQTYSVPPAVLVGMYEVEGGRVAREVGPYSDGSYLLGPMNISSNLIPELSDKWGVEPKIAYKWVKYDPCTNFGVSAWILRKHMNETGSLAQSIEEYGSGPLGEGEIYKKQVVDAMRKKGLLRDKAEID